MRKVIKNRLAPEAYAQGILEGDRAMLARAITLVESGHRADQALADEVLDRVMSSSGKALRIGVTGAPGVGKSTFIENFGNVLVARGYRLAVLAIDPSSIKSGGSIMGDKTRMESLSKDPNVFVRPSPGGLTLGGVAVKTRETMLLCEAAGFDVVLVETVGVGQSEVKVREMVDFVLVLSQPGAGDELQGVKRGLMEMADMLLVTKADGESKVLAKQTQQSLLASSKLLPKARNGKEVEVLAVSNIDNEALAVVWDKIHQYLCEMKESGEFEENRKRQRRYWFYSHVQQSLENQFYGDPDLKASIQLMLEEIENGTSSPRAVARNLVMEYFNKKK